MQMIKRNIAALLLCLVLMSAFATVSAMAETMDTSRTVSLTVNYQHEGASVAGVHFAVYYVASVNENLSFTLSDDFRAYPIRLDDLDEDGWRLLAETLSGYVKRDNLIPQDDGDTGTDGLLQFPNRRKSMVAGLYLAVGDTMTDDKYTYTTEPFLVCLPSQDKTGAGWLYDVTVVPKHTRDDKPIDPTTETIERRALKVWRDDIAAARPKEVTVQLLRDGAVYDTTALTAASGWTHQWSELPKYNADGSLVDWAVVEKPVDGYTVQVTLEGITFRIANTAADDTGDTVTRRVYKLWDDKGYESSRPSSVTVQLLRGGEVYDTRQLTAASDWTYSWDSLPRYDAAGKEISWTVKENVVSGYTADIRQSGANFTITNSIAKAKLPQTGSLWWPVPVLAAAGLVFLALGMLRRRLGRDDEET